jgi:hypothetical protein
MSLQVSSSEQPLQNKVFVLSKTTTTYSVSDSVMHFTDLYGYFDNKSIALQALQQYTNNEFLSRFNWSSRVEPSFDPTVECYKITSKGDDKTEEVEIRITEISKLKIL